MTTVRLGSGDDPLTLTDVWLETCSDGHSPVIYVCGAHGEHAGSGISSYQCPVCLGKMLARDEVLKEKGEWP